MPANDKWSQYEVASPAAKHDKWSQYEAAPIATASSAPVIPVNPPSTPSVPPEGFWSSVAAPFVGAAKGLKSAVYEGPQNPSEAAIVGANEKDPSWQSPILGRAVLAAKRLLVDPQLEQGRQAAAAFREAAPTSLHPTPEQLSQRQLALGHGLAAVLPGVGPWVASVGQKEGEQLGTDNYSGAAGTAFGNALLALTPKALGKAGEVVRNTPESLARAMTDTGAGPVKRLVEKTQEANKSIDAVNADRLERQQQAQAKADYDHRANLLKLRQQYEQSVRDATEKARTGTAKDRAEVQSKNLAAKQKYEQDVRDAQQKYENKKTEVTQSNTKAGADYQGKLLKLRQEYEQQLREANQKFSGNKAAIEQANAEARRQYNQKVGEIAQQNRAATAAERTKVEQEGKLQVGGSQLIYGLQQLDRALRDRAGTMFDAVREKVGTVTRPGTDLGTRARAALTKISGSSEVPKPFKDILAKYKEAEPNELPFTTSTGGTTMVPKGHPIYEVLKSQGAGAPPVTFGDLQGYYTETGAELAKGTLPGDVYLATKELHNAIGDMMQEMASGAGAGKEFWDSRVFYRNYMDTFHEPTGPSGSGSPVAQGLLAKDPAVAVDKFAGDAGDRGIATLRRYSDSLANLAQNVRRTAQEKITVPARKSAASIPAPEVKPVPAGANLPLPPVIPDAPIPATVPAGANLPLPGVVELPPAARASNLPLPPVLPEAETVPVELKPRQTISAPDRVAARRAAYDSRLNKIESRGYWAATWPLFQAARALWGGHIPSIPTMGLESAGMLATIKATTHILQYPPLRQFLEQARPEDLASIPPDLRGDLPGLVNLAQRQGIKVAPALVAATAGAARQPSQQVQQPAVQGAIQ